MSVLYVGLGVIISVLLIGFYYGVSYVLCRGALKDSKIKITQKDRIAVLAIFIVSLAVLYGIIENQKMFIYWDYGAYYDMALQSMEKLFTRPFDVIKDIFYSINNDEYNNVLAYMVALPLKLMGNRYQSFVYINYVLFLFPFYIVMALFFLDMCHRLGIKSLPYPGYIILGIIFPVFVKPLLLGYIDCAALLLIMGCIWISFTTDFTEVNVKCDIALAAGLLFILILRRYYAFFVIGYVVFHIIGFVCCIIKYSNHAECGFAKIKNYGINLVIIGLLSLVVLIGFLPEYTKRALFNNYRHTYSSYSSGDILTKLSSLITYWGVGMGVCCLVGMVYAIQLIKKEREKFFFFLQLIGLVVASALFFFSVQGMGFQHQYVVAIPIFILIIYGVICLYNCKKGNLLFTFVCIFFVLNVLNNFYVFSYSNFIFSSAKYEIVQRSDYNEVLKLLLYLETESENQKVYVNSSSEILNDDILRKAYYPDRNQRVNLTGVTHVDLRDGFPIDFLEAEIIVVCDPVQTHLQSGQDVVRTINDLLLNENCISENYVDEKVFYLEKDVSAHVFRKVKEFTDEEMDEIYSIFDTMYPDEKELFSDRIVQYRENYDRSDSQ